MPFRFRGKVWTARGNSTLVDKQLITVSQIRASCPRFVTWRRATLSPCLAIRSRALTGRACFFATATSICRILDGTSNTIAAGERSHLLGEATWLGSVTGALLAPGPDDLDGIGTFEVEHSSVMSTTGPRAKTSGRATPMANRICSTACIPAA